MKKVCVIGAFGFGKQMLNGQTVKTKILTDELIKEYGADNVMTLDYFGRRNLLLLIPRMLIAVSLCKNIIILPAHNAIKVIPILLDILNKIFHRSLHYDVIGGWLPSCLEESPRLIKYFAKYKGIYVETSSMQTNLQRMGLTNVTIVPNCKELTIVAESELLNNATPPLKFATFSRVMKEKGIEDAVNAIITANTKWGSNVFHLDIFGQIEKGQEEWFDNLMAETDSSVVSYGGLIPFDQSTNVLRNYYGLLFPTYYDGEGFAGTVIDAFAAGLPVIASDWKYNAEVVDDGVTGIICPTHDVEKLTDALLWSHSHSDEWYSMRKNCLQKAGRYIPHVALDVIKRKLS